MLKVICVAALAVVSAAPAAAAVITVPLGVIVVPPTQTFTPGLTFISPGFNQANFEFILSQAMTLTVSSFTNSSIGGTGVFDFTSIGLFAGLGTSGALLQTGSTTVDGNTRRASLNQFSLGEGAYTISYSGNVTGAPAGVGSNITFAAPGQVGAVPEPSSWALLMLGFGAIGFAVRKRTAVGTRIRFA